MKNIFNLCLFSNFRLYLLHCMLSSRPLVSDSLRHLWTAACQTSLSLTISWSLPEFTSIALVMPSSHFIIWHCLLLLPSIFLSIRDFSSELAVHIRWPTYWSFSFNISPSNQYLGLFSLKINWFDILAVQETYRSLQHHSSKPSTVTYNKSITCNKLNISPFRSTRPIKWSNV